MENEKKQKKSARLAEKNYGPNDYKKDSRLSSGLAMTHEQVSDTLTEGTIDGEIDDVKGKDEDLKGDQ